MFFIREYSWWSRHRSLTAFGAFALFAIIAITISVLIVCFAPPKPISMSILFTKVFSYFVNYNTEIFGFFQYVLVLINSSCVV
jgi:hypothetical protein